MAAVFVLQGELDGNVLPVVQHLMASYRVAGGAINYEVSPGAGHCGIIQPGLQTDRAIDMIKAFIARQLRARWPMQELRARGVHLKCIHAPSTR